MRIATISKNQKERDMEEIKQLRKSELHEDDFNLSHLDKKSKSELLKLLMEFGDIFSKRIHTIGRTEAIIPKFQVDTNDLPSIRPYTVPTSLKPELKRQLDELEAAKLIEKSTSHISFPLIMVKKRNDSGDPTHQQWRLVADFRKLNNSVRYNRYPLPLVNNLLENLSGSNLYSNLDLSSSFWQCVLPEKYRDVTTFNTIFGSYRYCVLPQGLNMSPGHMQQLTDQLLAPISDLNISNYIDDFCVGANDTHAMLLKLRKLFMQIRKYGLTLNPQKCTFLVPQTKFLGHCLNKDGIRPTDENLRKIQDFPIPNTVRKTRRWVGLVSYYRRFIPNFSHISAPLTDLTKKRQKFKLTEEAKNAFMLLKDKMSKSPILIHPDYSKEFILSTDSSDFAIASMLGQKDRFGIIHPISYFSKKLSSAQLKYPIMEKELLAIVESLKSFKTYLYGRKFTIRCDNSALQSIRKLESPANRVARWLLFIDEFDFTFQLIQSSQNLAADIFSRDYHSLNTLQISIPDVEQIKQEQYKDEKLVKLINKLNNTEIHLTPSEEKYFLRDGLLMHTAYFRRASGDKFIEQIAIPNKFKPNILEFAHKGHYGHNKTYDNIRENYYWQGLYEDCKHFVTSCKQCFEYKTPKRYAPVPLQRNFIPTRPMQFVSVDLIGRCSTTSKNNKYIIIFLDHFTRFIKIYPISNQSAKTSAEKFFEYICLLGTPEYLLTDLGTNFNSELFKEVSKKLGVTKLYTTPLNPKCNGANEITHRSLKKSISILARENSQWDDVLPFYEMIYNSTLHSTTKEKPSYLMLGYDIALPNSMLDPKYKPEYESYPDYIQSKTSMLQNAYKNVHANILEAAQVQESYQGRTAKPRIYNPGDLAYIYNPQADRYATLPKKRNYTGPVRILKKHNPVNYTISYTNYPHRKPEKVNSERLIPYTERKSHLEYKQEDTAQPILPSPPHTTYTMQEPEHFSHPKFSDDDSDNDEDNVPLLYLQTLYNENRASQNPQPPPVIQHNTPPSSPLLPTHPLNVQQPTTPHIHEKSTVQRQTPSTPLTSDDDEEDNIPLIQFTKSYNENRLIPQTSTGEKVTHPSQEVVHSPRKTLLPTPQPTYTTTFDYSITTPGIHYISPTPSPPSSPSTVVYEYNPKINDDSQRKEPNSDKSSHNRNLRTRHPAELSKHTHDLRSGKTPSLPTPTHTDSGENNLAERIFNWALRITDTTEDDSKNKSPNDVD